MMRDDQSLLRRFTESRSQEAFAELVRRHINQAYGRPLRTVGYDAHLAEDAVQVVFSTLARAAFKLTDRKELGGWIHTTAGFVAAKIART